MIECFPSASLTFIPAGRGVITPSPAGLSMGAFLLPTDPISIHSLTLLNVVVGSRICIRDQAKTEVKYDQLAASGAVSITLPVYASGSPLNDWMIDIRKGSAAPFYQRYKTFMSVTSGSSSHYVNQLPDQR